ncbi:hypothetical protein [Xylanimonas allomyrinae]|uniref:hypothetical protein n=1 Tax=Xylanimonas allomyrinae TaxID=2509459 RepID=UPI001FE266D0|nr:hypothetical protein [Xylanimonas allomyrinae]
MLIPLALAAASALGAAVPELSADGVLVQHVRTRMRDAALLRAALADTEAQVTAAGEVIVAAWRDVRAEFSRDGQGIWAAQFTGKVDAERATAIVTAVDVAYGRQVQQSVLARVRAQAPVAGMTVTSERVEADDSVTLVLTLDRPAG